MALSEKKKAQAQAIRELSESLDVEIVAHFYQRAEVRDLASFVGGSSAIIKRAQVSQARALLVCGVGFITETIARLRPGLPLVVPRADATCPYSEAAGAKEAALLLKEHPEALLLADLKASPELKDMADLLIPLEPGPDFWAPLADRPLIILPGAEPWEKCHAGPLYSFSKAICQVHEQVTSDRVLKAKKNHPKALILANILCSSKVREMSDFVGDSQSLFDFVGRSGARDFIVISEIGLIEMLSQVYPEKNFYDAETEVFCPNMKLTNLRDMLSALEMLRLVPECRKGPALLAGQEVPG